MPAYDPAAEAALVAARRSLAAFRSGLDMTSEPCECCGRHVHRSHAEFVVGDEVEAWIRKIDRWLAELKQGVIGGR